MPSPSRNHYRVLAVAPDASAEEIERSFRQLARRLHPDVNGGDGAAEERMKELNVARTTLSDPTARAAYDARLEQERREAQREAERRAAPARSPVPARAPEPLRAASAQPLVPWMRARNIRPAPPPSNPEIGRAASLGRLFWFTVAAAGSLAIVLLFLWLNQALGSR